MSYPSISPLWNHVRLRYVDFFTFLPAKESRSNFTPNFFPSEIKVDIS